jgi:hypothetical protein
MLISLPNQAEPERNLRREHRLWYDDVRYALSLGCVRCPDRTICGGLQVDHPLFDCLGFCCGNAADCDAVCRNRPDEFARRVREIQGFAFDNVPHAPKLDVAPLPFAVPAIFHGDRRRTPFQTPVACLPLYEVIQRHDGEARYTNHQELTQDFKIAAGTTLILTGTAADPPLERWWSLGQQRRDAIRALRGLGIGLVTTPNYSLFIDQPRWDDLHSMKRIAIVHEEFLSEGLPAALHVNARTDRDWSRWRDYIAARPEITHIAFEFSTGAGWGSRMQWHADQLARLAAGVDRPLHLIVRGGTRVLQRLYSSFQALTLVETSSFVKTMRRQRAVMTPSGTLSWRPSPTQPSETLDALFAENWRVVSSSWNSLLEQEPSSIRVAG